MKPGFSCGPPSAWQDVTLLLLAVALLPFAQCFAPTTTAPWAILSPTAATARLAGARATAPGGDDIISRAQLFLDEATGFYSELKPEFLADDFVFRGGVVGPLNKADYVDTMEKLGVYRAFNLEPNAFGFTVDPSDPLTVRFFVRNRGCHVGKWQPWGALPPLPLEPDPERSAVVGPTEAAMVTFEPETLQVRFFTTGNVVKFGDGPSGVNTGGLGAVLGLFHAIGIGDVGNLALDANVRGLSNWAANNVGALKIPRTKSENAPAWWTEG